MEPKRIVDDEGPAARLLGSALLDAHDERAVERAALRLGLIGLGASSASGGTGAGKGAASVGSGAAKAGFMLVKLVGLGLLASSIVVGTLAMLQQTLTPAPSALAPVSSSGAERAPAAGGRAGRELAPEVPTIAVTDLPSAAAKSTGPVPRESSRAPVPSAPHDEPGALALGAEVALLDEARSALARGDANAALASLARHDREFPGGFLGTEAEVVRIQALLASGRRTEAKSRGDALLAREPNGPQARRVRSILEKNF